MTFVCLCDCTRAHSSARSSVSPRGMVRGRSGSVIGDAAMSPTLTSARGGRAAIRRHSERHASAAPILPSPPTPSRTRFVNAISLHDDARIGTSRDESAISVGESLRAVRASSTSVISAQRKRTGSQSSCVLWLCAIASCDRAQARQTRRRRRAARLC
jgi:hypothetical protein